MEKIKIFQVDAFTNNLFSGNPAAVCILDNWLADKVMQSIASENNLSETAYIIKKKINFLLGGLHLKLK
jgi:PhzF family phenazine biosynthesis protein